VQRPDESLDASGRVSRAPKLGPVLVHLLKGVVYRDQHPLIWDDLRTLQSAALDYFKTIGLDLVVDEADGFAYLRQDPDLDEGTPRLIQRRPMSAPMSLLCVLLRKKMVEADAGGGDGRVILSHEQITEMMRLFWPRRADESRIDDRIEQQIRRAVEFELLKPLKSDGQAYELRPIIKALVDADWLAGLDEKLEAYQDAVARPDRSGGHAD
jgi:hypothetical protein